MYFPKINSVRLTVGSEHLPVQGLEMHLGNLSCKVVYGGKDEKIVRANVPVAAIITDVRKYLTIPGVRNEWEKELRLQVGSNEEYRSLFPDPHLITDVYPVRLNSPVSLVNAGWRNNWEALNLDEHLDRVDSRETTNV